MGLNRLKNDPTTQSATLIFFCRDWKRIVKAFKDEGGVGVTDVDVKQLYAKFMVRFMDFNPRNTDNYRWQGSEMFLTGSDLHLM